MSMRSRSFLKQSGPMRYPPLPHPEADLVAVRQWVREFATAMSMSELLDDFDNVVARSKSRR